MPKFKKAKIKPHRDYDLDKIDELDYSLSDGQRTVLQVAGVGEPSELVKSLIKDAQAGEIRESAEHNHHVDDENDHSSIDDLLQVAEKASKESESTDFKLVKSGDSFTIIEGPIFDRNAFLLSIDDALKGMDVNDQDVLSKLKCTLNSTFKIDIPAEALSLDEIKSYIPMEGTYAGKFNLIPTKSTCSLSNIFSDGNIAGEFNPTTMDYAEMKDNSGTVDDDGQGYELPPANIPPLKPDELDQILNSTKENTRQEETDTEVEQDE